MKTSPTAFLSALAVILALSCSPLVLDKRASDSGRATSDRYSAEDRAQQIFNRDQGLPASFQDRTEEVVRHAERLIKNNKEEGAVLDQRWYGLKYFGKHQNLILSATQIFFFGGLEKDVRTQFANRYRSIEAVEENQDSGDVRLYTGKQKTGYDFIIIGQNGNEVALKTIIRLLYLARFADDQTKQKYRAKLRSFNKSLRVLMSSVSAYQEFIAFFKRHGIANPDAVMIGFRGDIRPLMKDAGISDPESYTDESLRVNWYSSANGKKVLLVSIDKNRIFASRSGELIRAIFAISAGGPPSIIFLGSAGAIDAPDLVGQIVTPVRVMNGFSDRASRDSSVLAHLIRNRAADETGMKSADITVENVVVETIQWARKMKDRRVDTVDQELFHIVNAINSSSYAAKVDFFAGHLVTDNVSSNAQNTQMTLEHAEDVISATTDVRKQFLSKILTNVGILKNEPGRLPARSRLEQAPFRFARG